MTESRTRDEILSDVYERAARKRRTRAAVRLGTAAVTLAVGISVVAVLFGDRAREPGRRVRVVASTTLASPAASTATTTGPTPTTDSAALTSTSTTLPRRYVRVTPVTGPAQTCAHSPVIVGGNEAIESGTPDPGIGSDATWSNLHWRPGTDATGTRIGFGSTYEIVLTRANGAVTTLRNPPGFAGAQQVLFGWDDLDGDGVTDAMIGMATSNGGGRRLFVVSTRQPAGDVAITAVGREIAVRPWRLVGDQNLDGIGDLQLDAAIHSGKAVIEAGAAKLPDPITTTRHLPSDKPFTVLRYGDRYAPLIVQDLFVLDGATTHYLVPFNTPPAQVSGVATGAIVDGHRYVTLGNTDRGGSFYWRYDLDEPCGT